MFLPLLNIVQDYNKNSFYPNSELENQNDCIVQEYYEPNIPRVYTNSWEDKGLDRMITCSFMEHQNNIDKWIHSYNMFKNSFEEKKSLFTDIPDDIIFDNFKSSLNSILSIYPDTLSVGVSDDECAYIYFEKNKKSVYFDLFFELDQPAEISITLFEDKVSKFSFSDNLENSINKLLEAFNNSDELSYSTFA